MKRKNLTFEQLISSIKVVHDHFAAQAGKAVNISMTLRNWVIGCYIREYEQNGADRAEYGVQLLDNLSIQLAKNRAIKVSARNLRLFRQFYLTYSQIWQTVSAKLPQSKKFNQIWQSVSAKCVYVEDGSNNKPSTSISADIVKCETLPSKASISAEELLRKLSFSHFAELIVIDDPVKRSFYEIECIRGNWSVRGLKRQINSLYYERCGLSKNKKKLAETAKSTAEKADHSLAVRDPYVFEFLGLKAREVMGESNLEDALLDKLQDFLLELGRDFCFEARQKRILIGDEYFFVDLVFYHRILKCHILIELKADEFTHGYLGQLNTYVNWYKDNEMADGDNLPVGILLCTRKNHALVKYALAGIDNRLFVSKYQLELPRKEEIQRFMESQLETDAK